MRTRTALTVGLLGTASAVGAYLFNRPKLRKQMMEAKSPNEAVNLFTSEVGKDTAELAHSVQEAAVHNWLVDEIKDDMKKVKHDADTLKSELMHSASRMKQKAKATVDRMTS